MTTTPAPDPFAGLLDALALRLAPLVADLVVQQLRAAAPAPELSSGLVDKRTAARAVAVSVATLDRFVREGAPVHIVGARRRYDIPELRVWLEARGRRPAAPPSSPRAPVVDDEIEDVAHAAGLRHA